MGVACNHPAFGSALHNRPLRLLPEQPQEGAWVPVVVGFLFLFLFLSVNMSNVKLGEAGCEQKDAMVRLVRPSL